MKKLLSICLAVLVVVGLMPVYALAAEGDQTVTVGQPSNGTLTVTYGGDQTITGTGTVPDSTSLTITATPADDYELEEITVNSDAGNQTFTSSPATYTVNGAAVQISAKFKAVSPSVTQYKVTYDAAPTGGTISVAKTNGGNVSSGDMVDDGTQITITATAGQGYTLTPDSIQVNGVKITGSTYTVDKETTSITAAFVKDPVPVVTHAVKWKTDSNGSIKVTVNGTEIKSGDQVAKDAKFTVTATPDNGYVLDKLTVTGATQDGDTSTYTVGTSDVDISATFKYNGGTSVPSYVYRPIGVYDDDGDWLEDNSGSSFPRPSSDGKVVLDGVLPNQTFYIKLGDAGNDYVTELSGGGKARASQLVDDNLFKISVDKDGDGKSLISKIEQVEEKRLGGMTRASYLKVTLKDMTSTDERKANAEIEFKAKKDKDGSWKKGETAILNLNMWISNKKVSGSDGDADTGEKIYFSPEANENNVLIWGDDRAALEFTADDDAKDFYARLSTKSMSDIYSEYGDPVDADLWFYDFVGNPSIPSTSRAYLTLGIPWDDDDDYTPNPHDVYIYRLDKDGYLEDVTAMFTYSEDDREIEGWTTRTRTLGTYIVSDTELDIDSYYDDDDDTEVPSIDVSNNQKPVPNTGR